MGDFMFAAYPWIKALHVISVVAWMAGLLYLPRLFVYHREAPRGSDQAATFEVMERRLLRAIMNPAMIATFVFGGILLGMPGAIDWGAGWIWVKLASVVALAGLHHRFARWRKDLAAGRDVPPARRLRIWNEAPAVLLVVVVVMVIVRPF